MEQDNPSYLIAAILLFYPEERFVNDRETLHTIFFNLRMKHRYLLRNFTFRDSLLFPRSSVLDDTFASLMPEFLQKEGDYSTYIIYKKRLQLLWDKTIKNILGEHEVELKQIAQELGKQITKEQKKE